MAGGLFSRLNTRTTGGTITAADDDADLDNIINNLLPAKLDDYSLNNAQMQSTRDPYPGDTVSLSTNLAEELEGIRHILAQITGETYWYIDPDTTMAAVNTHYSDTTTHGTTGDIVGTTDTQTLSAKTLTTPTIASFVNAIHNHADAAGGGILNPLQTETDTSGNDTALFYYHDIPSWVKKITIMFAGVSTAGTSNPIIQLGTGTSGSPVIEATGYLGAAVSMPSASSPTVDNHNTGFLLQAGTIAGDILHGNIVLTLEDSANFVWTVNGTLGHSNDTEISLIAGSTVLSAALTQIRLTTVGGSDNFDAGGFNISWE